MDLICFSFFGNYKCFLTIYFVTRISEMIVMALCDESLSDKLKEKARAQKKK